MASVDTEAWCFETRLRLINACRLCGECLFSLLGSLWLCFSGSLHSMYLEMGVERPGGRKDLHPGRYR